MKTLKFEYDGRPFRVYLDRDGAVFVDVKDLAGEEYLEGYPAEKLIDERPVWTESMFFHVLIDEMDTDRFMFFYMDEMDLDPFMFFYMETVQPAIRSALIQEKEA